MRAQLLLAMAVLKRVAFRYNLCDGQKAAADELRAAANCGCCRMRSANSSCAAGGTPAGNFAPLRSQRSSQVRSSRGGAVIGRLFVRSTERAERIHAAMCARGWK